MVNAIDIHNLTLEELTGIIDLYPWYGAARRELCERMARHDALTDSQISEAALYIGKRRVLYDLHHAGNESDYTDKPVPQTGKNDPMQKQILVVGGDYFSKNDYDTIHDTDDSILPKFTAQDCDNEYVEPPASSGEEIYTETLAQIYLDQDYPDKAKEIYSKLSLRYPEKSVYFATLIDEINKKDN